MIVNFFMSGAGVLLLNGGVVVCVSDRRLLQTDHRRPSLPLQGRGTTPSAGGHRELLPRANIVRMTCALFLEKCKSLIFAACVIFVDLNEMNQG